MVIVMAPNLPPLVTIQEPTPPSSLNGMPLFRLGFRPFYLGAALLAALAVPIWIGMFFGRLPLNPAVAPVLWHAHEMLFGFAIAVIVGFLMTAGKAWTGLATPRGPALAALFVLWLAARLASVASSYPVYAVLDVLFLPVVAVIFLKLLLRANNRRNLPLAALLMLLAGSNIAFHLAVSERLAIPPVNALHAALALIILIECVMAGRVIPAFTMSATPGLKLHNHPGMEKLTLLLTLLALSLWVFTPGGWMSMMVLATAAVLHVQRQWQWQPWVTRGRPLLWILHVAYAWIPLGLGLLALAQIGIVPVSAGLHALAVGATGGLIIAMMTRTARGHTGRQLMPTRAEVVAYALLVLAATLRVFLPLLSPTLLPVSLIGTALAWTAAFTIYLFIYTPWLLQSRADGRDG